MTVQPSGDAALVRALGVRLVDFGAGRCVLGLTLRPDHMQHGGSAHGGVIGTLADNAAGAAASTVLPAGFAAVTAEYRISFLTPAMAIYHEESFGPVKPVARVNGEEAAIACANDSPQGLSSAVFTRDAARGLRVAQRIESGICHVNGPTVHDEAQMPFGGVKHSGLGRFGGRAGIDSFTELRWVTVQAAPRGHPF